MGAFAVADAVRSSGGTVQDAGRLLTTEACRRREDGVVVDPLNIYDNPCEPDVAMETAITWGVKAECDIEELLSLIKTAAELTATPDPTDMKQKPDDEPGEAMEDISLTLARCAASALGTSMHDGYPAWSALSVEERGQFVLRAAACAATSAVFAEGLELLDTAAHVAELTGSAVITASPEVLGSSPV